MAALNLHRALFTRETDLEYPLHSATPFLHSAPERSGSPHDPLFASVAYQDLIQRQPTHPDGPTSGWDLGLNLLGDPITAAEHKNSEDHQTKMKLRRLYATNTVFELLFAIWGMYTTVRYCLAFANGLRNPMHISALALGIMSALALAFVIMSVFIPLVPQHRTWRRTTTLLRACYLFLLSASALINLILVLIWRPNQFCHWDLDVSWYTSPSNIVTTCHPASLAAWVAAAVLRLVVTSTMALSFAYSLRSFYGIRHSTSEENSPNYSPYFQSDAEYISPVSTSSPYDHILKSNFKCTQSEDSCHTLNQSNVTLPKSNSISTLTPSTSCTGHTRSRSTPPPTDVSLPRISPPTSRITSVSTHAVNYESSKTQQVIETPSQTPTLHVVTATPLAPHILRPTNRISVTQMTSEVMSPDTACPERSSNPMGTHDPSEIRSGAVWKPSHRGTGTYLDGTKSTLPLEATHVGHTAQAAVVSDSCSSAHVNGESIKERDKADEALVYSYGYGAPEPTYPYLDMYNPQTPRGYAETSLSCAVADDGRLLRGRGRAILSGPAFSDVSSEPQSSSYEEEYSGEEEEYVAMMGGFVRRMATIESLGSKEAGSVLSGSVALCSTMRSKRSLSQFSSARFADHGSSGGCSSFGVPLSMEGSFSTAYFSLSSGGTGMRVNERGELLPGLDSRSIAGSP